MLKDIKGMNVYISYIYMNEIHYFIYMYIYTYMKFLTMPFSLGL